MYFTWIYLATRLYVIAVFAGLNDLIRLYLQLALRHILK